MSFLTPGPLSFRPIPALPKKVQTVYFTRYEEDTNQDGVVDTDDESSIWLTRWQDSTPETTALYRLTPAGQFHLYPASAKEYVYFTDLKKGDIFRIHVEDFLTDYASIETAKELSHPVFRYRATRPRASGLEQHLT